MGKTVVDSNTLKKLGKVFMDVGNCINEIAESDKDGNKVLRSICNKYNIDPNSLRRLLKLDTVGKLRSDKEVISTVDLRDLTQSPFEVLYSDIFYAKEKAINLPFDFEESVKYVINNFLTFREGKLIKLYYGLYEPKMTFNEITILPGMPRTLQSFRRTKDSALQKCRSYVPYRILKLGISAYNLEEKEKELRRITEAQKIKEAMDNVDRLLEEGYKALSNQPLDLNKERELLDLSEISNEDKSKIVYNIFSISFETNVDEFLTDQRASKRLVNSIRRHSKYHNQCLFKVMQLEDDELGKIRNFGKESLKELSSIFDKYLIRFGINWDGFRKMIKSLYDNYGSFINNMLVFYAKYVSDMPITSKIDKIDAIADIIRIVDYHADGSNIVYIFKGTPYYVNNHRYKDLDDFTLLDIIRRSILYYNLESDCFSPSIFISTHSMISGFFKQFGMTHDDYLAEKLIVRNDKNEEKYNTKYQFLTSLIKTILQYMNMNIHFIVDIVETENRSKLNDIYTSVFSDVKSSIHSDTLFVNGNRIDYQSLNIPYDFRFTDLDPKIVKTLLSDCIESMYNDYKARLEREIKY